jgi:hypothetical protein
MIEHLGKGAIRQEPDKRNFKFSAPPQVDWSTPFFCDEPPNEDQNGSSSCVAQANSYYHWQLKRKDYSRRDIYSQIHLPGGGAYVVAGVQRIVKYGQATRDEVPDPTPETEFAMQDKTGVTLDKEKSDQEQSYYEVSDNIDQYAAAIKAGKGVVGGLDGTNAGWKDLANPQPPTGNPEWGHCLYFFGYHLHDGQKCVIAKSSWGTSGNTTVHHIKENYFSAGHMFNAYVILPKGQDMNQAKVIKSKTSPTVYVCYPVPSMDYLKTKSELEGFSYDPANIPNSDTL